MRAFERGVRGRKKRFWLFGTEKWGLRGPPLPTHHSFQVQLCVKFVAGPKDVKGEYSNHMCRDTLQGAAVTAAVPQEKMWACLVLALSWQWPIFMPCMEKPQLTQPELLEPCKPNPFPLSKAALE